MDSKKRIIISPELRDGFQGREEINFYYSVEERLFYLLPGKIVSDELYITTQRIDYKFRFYLPVGIKNCYRDLADMIVAKKNGRLYLVPIFKDDVTT